MCIRDRYCIPDLPVVVVVVVVLVLVVVAIVVVGGVPDNRNCNNDGNCDIFFLEINVQLLWYLLIGYSFTTYTTCYLAINSCVIKFANPFIFPFLTLWCRLRILTNLYVHIKYILHVKYCCNNYINKIKIKLEVVYMLISFTTRVFVTSRSIRTWSLLTTISRGSINVTC